MNIPLKTPKRSLETSGASDTSDASDALLAMKQFTKEIGLLESQTERPTINREAAQRVSRQQTARVELTRRYWNGRKIVSLPRPRHMVICEMCEYRMAGVNEHHAEEIRVKHLKTAHLDKLINGTATIHMGEQWVAEGECSGGGAR